MLIESKIKIGHGSMFNIHQANFKSAHLLNKMALIQFQSNRTVINYLNMCNANILTVENTDVYLCSKSKYNHELNLQSFVCGAVVYLRTKT